MLDRRHLVHSLRLIAALALMTLVQAALVRSSAQSVPPRLDGPSVCLASPFNQSDTHLANATNPNDGSLENVLASEDEEQDQVDAIADHQAPEPIFCVYRRDPARQLIAPHAPPSYYPLRC